jgi:perosamine synthetase
LRKESVMAQMDEKGIQCRPFFHPLSSLPAYEHFEHARTARERNRISYRLSPYGLNLPSALNMTQAKVKYVCDALKEILNQPGLACASREEVS